MIVFAQILGLIGMLMNVSSFQCKQQKQLIRFQLYGGIIFSVHFWLLGAVTGSVLNVVCIFRALVFSNKERAWARWKGWPVVFILAYFVVYALNFLVFGMEPTAWNLIVELLPTIGVVAVTIGFAVQSVFYTRMSGLINSPTWLVYNSINGSVGGILTEALSLLSILAGILRLDLKMKKE